MVLLLSMNIWARDQPRKGKSCVLGGNVMVLIFLHLLGSRVESMCLLFALEAITTSRTTKFPKPCSVL